MMFLAVLLLASSVYGQQKCIHSNSGLMTEDKVIRQVLTDMDTNGDQRVTDLELLIEFVGKFDTNGDSSITKTEFVQKWQEIYKDGKDFAEYIFCHFDMNGDGSLGLYDVPPIKAKVDLNVDGIVSDVEFTIFLTHLYMDCVPHTHLQTVNGYC